ncbi:Centrosomal protein of 295 kDa [Frankliniella fusca]|uniref:Centrosomal protein of 295 kDa n=1 Tax=Frankliniella fusca TaxID=407009 RepID=A0AAE1GV68_9NEOP|nr:Centrosomal protein of 295 kDa [Frankliniella fusca]
MEDDSNAGPGKRLKLQGDPLLTPVTQPEDTPLRHGVSLEDRLAQASRPLGVHLQENVQPGPGPSRMSLQHPLILLPRSSMSFRPAGNKLLEAATQNLSLAGTSSRVPQMAVNNLHQGPLHLDPPAAPNITQSFVLQPTEKLVPINLGTALEWDYFVNNPSVQEIPSEVDISQFIFPHSYFDDSLHPLSSEDTPPVIQQQEEVHLKLFSNSTLSVSDSVVALLQLATSCHMSGTDFCKLLDCVHLLLPKPNNLPPTRHAVFNIFKDDSTALNISLTWYFDGVSLYNCSSYSLWPFLFVINELPPEERFKPENLIIGGLWGDSAKPHPNLFLLPLYHEIVKLKEGFPVKLHGEENEREVKGIVLFGTADVPAKATFMCMKGHSGYYSCPKCLISGEKSARTGMVMVFPHAAELILRNDENYNECVQNSVRLKAEDRGVFGPSILSYMMYSSFIKGTSIDSMHCVSLGIVKQLLRLWFDSKLSNEPFSLSKFIDKANTLLRNLNLPHFVQRLPEDVTKLHFWKASLCRNFLLYIALFTMKAIMKPEYYANFCLLVDGIALLHRSSITASDIALADEFLTQFCRDFERLYGVRHMSSNIHLLRHLATSVLECGNLCLTSCFRFEDLNGKLADLVHGTTHATKQIFKNLSVLSELPLLVSSVQSVEVKSFCRKLTNHNYLTVSENISKNIFVVGNIDEVTQHFEKISELCSNVTQVEFRTFSRLFKKGSLFVSSSYTKGSRVSCYCKYVSSNGPVHGKILTFVKVCSSPPMYLAYISRSDFEPIGLQRHVIFSTTHETTDLISVTDLICLSWYLQVEGIAYIVDPLNPYEME